MPPDSEPGPVRLPRTWRPYGARIAMYVAAIMLALLCGVVWVLLSDTVRAGFTPFQRVTLVILGLMLFASWNSVIRSKVVAETDRLVVVNGYRRREYPWAQVVGVTLGRGAPWAKLDLDDGNTATAFAIQGSDGERAQRAVRELRAVLAQQS